MSEVRSDKVFSIVREQRVSWFDVRQLFATAVKTVSSTVIGSMSGRRELMAALEPGEGEHYDLTKDASDDGALWIDWIADCGDGWNASYSVAWLVGRDNLRLAADHSPTEQPIPDRCDAEAGPAEDAKMLNLPAGHVLVLGGDQVYPTASVEAYQNRFAGPMTCARVTHGEHGRKLFALPGNHDWYDGLTSFIRLFCQSPASRRWFGAWQTQQRRSYFALELPHGWWLWGVDMALEDDLDPSQQDYFRAMAAKLHPDDRLILAVPTPVWIKVDSAEALRAANESRTYAKLQLILDLAEEAGTPVPLLLTGDHHFYAHHHGDDDQRHFVICGGGGAFGLGTVEVPESVTPPGGGTARAGALFPDRAQSEALRWKVLGFAWVNPFFSATLVVLQLLGLWQLGASIRWGGLGSGWIDVAAHHSLAGFLLRAAAQALATPSLAIWAGVLVLGFIGFASAGAKRGRSKITAALAGLAHVALQAGGLLTIAWLLVQHVTLAPWALLPLLAAAGYLWCGELFGLYLAVMHKFCRMHNLEVYSAQGIEDWKSFLRLRIDAGGVTVHPIGLRRVAKRWRAAPAVTLKERLGKYRTHGMVTVPPGCLRAIDPATPLAPQLIEEPFTIPGGKTGP